MAATQLSDRTKQNLEVQAGGGEVSQTPLVKEVKSIGPSLLPYIKSIADGSRPLEEAQFQELRAFRGSDKGSDAGDHLDLSSVLSYLTSIRGAIQGPLESNNLDRPLPEYFVSSSHNTYLTGNQIYSASSTETYRDVLLRGCRCIEIDVWDGEDEISDSENEGKPGEKERGLRSRISNAINKHRKEATHRANEGENRTEQSEAGHEPLALTRTTSRRVEPRVLHGHTLTKEVSFRDVCTAIKKAAFVNSDLPVIVSLEIHAGADQQEIMIEIMKQAWGPMLVLPPKEEAKILPTPAELKKKILIKVKAAANPHNSSKPAKPADVKAQDVEEDTSQSEADQPTPSKVSKRKKPSKKSKVIEALSSMGIYTRGYHFSKLDSPEAVIPSHVFSLSERKIVQVHEYFGPSLFLHNRNYFMRAYPAGLRVSSSNLDPSVFWRKFGVQLVALNWQRIDAGVMLNEGQFAGSGGWVLKPEAYRSAGTSSGNTTDASKSYVAPDRPFNLYIEVLAAQDLPVQHDSLSERIHPYIKCQLHVGTPQERVSASEDGKLKTQEEPRKLRTKSSKTISPDFGGEMLQFSKVTTVEALSFLRFKIQNDSYGRDRLLAWACIRLDRLRTGYRLLHLLDAKGYKSRAILLVNIRKEATS